MDKLDKLLGAANERLKISNAGLTIVKRGKKLSIRGMLPPKPGKKKSSQQFVSLGIFCNAAGIKSAEKQAQTMASEIALDNFKWESWSEKTHSLESVDHYIDLFEKDYFERRDRTTQSETTFYTEYQAMFRRLPGGEKLSVSVLLDLILATKPDGRQRKRAVMVASALARFAGLNVDFKRYRGSYSHLLGDRQLPTDKQIVDYYWSIPNSDYQFAFGLQAAYGVSNHELFYVDLDSLRDKPHHLKSSYRKNHYGTRYIWCLYPEWFEQWDLGNPKKKLPDVTGKNNQALGSKITKGYARYGVCKPGDLRHCWAIRAMGFMPNPMAARMMAHSETEHNKTYQRWINHDQEQEFYSLLMARTDRPKPPQV